MCRGRSSVLSSPSVTESRSTVDPSIHLATQNVSRIEDRLDGDVQAGSLKRLDKPGFDFAVKLTKRSGFL